jgi:hypothetical protein
VASSSHDSGGAGSSRACGAATSCRSPKGIAAPSRPNGLSCRAPAAAGDGCNRDDPASIDAGASVARSPDLSADETGANPQKLRTFCVRAVRRAFERVALRVRPDGGPAGGVVGVRRFSSDEGASSSSVRRRVACPQSLTWLAVGTPPGTSSLPRPILRRPCFSWSRSLIMREVTHWVSSASRHPICRCAAVGYSRNPATNHRESRAQRGPCSALRFHGAEPGTRRYAAT